MEVIRKYLSEYVGEDRFTLSTSYVTPDEVTKEIIQSLNGI